MIAGVVAVLAIAAVVAICVSTSIAIYGSPDETEDSIDG